MSLETGPSAHPPKSHLDRSPVSSEEQVPQTATSQVPEDSSRLERVRGGCGPQTARSFDHRPREDAKPFLNEFTHRSPEGPCRNPRVKHNSPFHFESHVNQNYQTVAPYALFELPHRMRQIGNAGLNDHEQFSPLVSYGVLSVCSRLC